jgi:hypothetical protein
MHVACRVPRSRNGHDAAGQRDHRDVASAAAGRRLPLCMRYEHGAWVASRRGGDGLRHKTGRRHCIDRDRHTGRHAQDVRRGRAAGRAAGGGGTPSGDSPYRHAGGHRHRSHAPGVRPHDAHARQSLARSFMADEPLAAGHTHHPGHVLLRGADPPRRMAGTVASFSGHELVGGIGDHRRIPVQHRLVLRLGADARGVERALLRVGRRSDHARSGRTPVGGESP